MATAKPGKESWQLAEPDQTIAAVCPACRARVLLAHFRSDGFLRSRRSADGGPYYELACSRCATVLQLRWEPDGSRVVEPRPRTRILGCPFRYAGEQAQRFPPETAEEQADYQPGPGPDPTPPDESSRKPEPPPELELLSEPREDIVRMREILGVDDTAGRASILAAFRERSKRIHPDRFTEFDRDFQALAHRKFIELKRARDCLLAIIERR